MKQATLISVIATACILVGGCPAEDDLQGRQTATDIEDGSQGRQTEPDTTTASGIVPGTYIGIINCDGESEGISVTFEPDQRVFINRTEYAIGAQLLSFSDLASLSLIVVDVTHSGDGVLIRTNGTWRNDGVTPPFVGTASSDYVIRRLSDTSIEYRQALRLSSVTSECTGILRN